MSRGPGKYAPLRRYLVAQPGDRLQLTFAQLEVIIGAPLPPSALHRTWWSNVDRFTQAQAWLRAGWRRTYVDVWARVVVFERLAVTP